MKTIFQWIQENPVVGSVGLVSSQKAYDARISNDRFEMRMNQWRLSKNPSGVRRDTESVLIGMIFTVSHLGAGITESRTDLQSADAPLEKMKIPSDLFVYYLPEPEQSLSLIDGSQVYKTIIS